MTSNSRAQTNYWLSALMFLIGFSNVFFTEKIELSNGHNWDGVLYASWAKDFFHEIFEKGVSDYSVQRILPSGVVHYAMRLFRVPFDEANIIFAFGIWNLTLLVLCAYLWGKISDCLNLSQRGKWLGFCGLFINYSVLKMNAYYPVLTDIPGFALGMLSFYFYLTRRPKALLITSLLGAFTWPTVFLFGLLLFLFADWKVPQEKVSPRESKRGWQLASLMTLIFLGFIIKIIVKTEFFTQMTKMHVYQTPNLAVLNLSIVLAFSYLFFAFYHFFNANTFSWKDLRSSFNVKRFLIVVVCFISVQWVIQTLAVSEHLVDTKRTLYRIHTTSISNPLISGVAHIIYYGPILILTAFLWKSFCKTIQPYGIGLILVTTAAIDLSIGSESRQWCNFLPIFIAFTCKAADSLSWKTSHYWLIAIFQLLYSKVWLVINPLGPPIGLGTDHQNILVFPYQKYYMSHGPFMSDITYAAQGSVVLVTAFLFHIALFKESRVTSPP